MKIAVTSTGPELSSTVDPRFGRAAYFLLVDPDTMDHEAVENVQNLSLPQGAGIQAAQSIANLGASALLTGNCGPKAFKVLSAAGVAVFDRVGGRVIDAVLKHRNGELTPAAGANVEGHWV